MPIKMTDVDGGSGVLITATGELTGSAFLDAFRAHLTQDPNKFRRYRYSLSDYTNADVRRISRETVRTLATMCRTAATVNPDVVAATVANGDLEFGLARMWEILTDETEWEHQVFRSAEDAKNWITERVKDRWNLAGPATR